MNKNIRQYATAFYSEKKKKRIIKLCRFKNLLEMSEIYTKLHPETGTCYKVPAVC